MASARLGSHRRTGGGIAGAVCTGHRGGELGDVQQGRC
jgi:hypothetical protein